MPDKISLRFLLNSWSFNANILQIMLTVTGRWQWADPLNAEPLTFYIYIAINCVIHGFHFLSSWSLSRAPTNSASPLAPYILSSLSKTASPIPWPAFAGHQPHTLYICSLTQLKPLPYPSDLLASEAAYMVSASEEQADEKGVVGWEPQAGSLAAQPLHECIRQH